MEMSDKEILRNWESAKDKKRQIQILAELNSTSQQAIRQILVKEGVDHRLLPRERKQKTEETTPTAVSFAETVGESLAKGIAAGLTEKKLPTVEPRHKHDFRRMAELFEAICAGEMNDEEPRPEWEEEFDELWRKHYIARHGGVR